MKKQYQLTIGKWIRYGGCSYGNGLGHQPSCVAFTR